MNAVALISQNPSDQQQSAWQYDKVMAAIAFDIDLIVVFIEEGLKQIQNNKAWKSLDLYGVEQVFYVSETPLDHSLLLFKVEQINSAQLSDLIANTEMVL